MGYFNQKLKGYTVRIGSWKSKYGDPAGTAKYSNDSGGENLYLKDKKKEEARQAASVSGAQKKAKEANEKRYEEGKSIYDEIISQYSPGGSFGQGAMAQYETGKRNAMASGMQSLVSGGMANTTVGAGMPLKYEQEVGTPFRLQLEDMRMNRLAQAKSGKAGFIERRTDQYPDMSMFSNLMTNAAR